MWHQKWARHTPPFLEPMGAISVAVPKQGSMELGGQNWAPQKHKLRKIGANFWAPLLTPFAYRVMLFQNILINPACQAETWEAHMTRSFFQPKSSPISRPMKPRRSQSHIPNCASCCSKSSTADTQWKIPDMCVRGCSLASMWFNYKDERRLALGTIWCKVNLYFVRSRFILYRILCIWHLHVHGDQNTMHISMYILYCSGMIVYILLPCQSLCIFGRVRWMCLSGVLCSLFDLVVWELPVTMVFFKSLSLKIFPLNEALFCINAGILQGKNIK